MSIFKLERQCMNQEETINLLRLDFNIQAKELELLRSENSELKKVLKRIASFYPDRECGLDCRSQARRCLDRAGQEAKLCP